MGVRVSRVLCFSALRVHVLCLDQRSGGLQNAEISEKHNPPTQNAEKSFRAAPVSVDPSPLGDPPPSDSPPKCRKCRKARPSNNKCRKVLPGCSCQWRHIFSQQSSSQWLLPKMQKMQKMTTLLQKMQNSLSWLLMPTSHLRSAGKPPVPKMKKKTKTQPFNKKCRKVSPDCSCQCQALPRV